MSKIRQDAIARQPISDVGCNYMPSPQEIRERCREIQAGWSEMDELTRNSYSNPSAEIKYVHESERRLMKRTDET